MFRLHLRKLFRVLVAILATVAASRSPIAAASDATGDLPSGALRNAVSLYLREAANDPVKWQPWGPDAFELARRLNRPMLIDIGAVWCHWCHVMDQTTYADPEVVRAINQGFVPVKVDTDERPDIDSYYQAAGEDFRAGGWPLTCFTAANGAPFLILGYVPPRPRDPSRSDYGMVWVLNQVRSEYATNPDLRKTAVALAAKLATGAGRLADRPGSLDRLFSEITGTIKASYDARDGGFGSGDGPRFYDFPAIRFALARGFFGKPDFMAIASNTLKRIAAGGVYDQLAGGFHRYSTDPDWRIPHFEKMGYDQAMALRTYVEVYEATGDDEFASTARSIVSYVNRVLLDSHSHTFYSHQDADAFRGDDGSYYTWTTDEIRRALSTHDSRAALMYFGFDTHPATMPDGRVALRRAMSDDEFASKMRIAPGDVRATIDRITAQLLAVRERRKPPDVDTTALVDRNALMASSYLVASAALHDQHLKSVALDDLKVLMTLARAPDGGYYHVLSHGTPSVPGLVADQVYMTRAMLDAYAATGQARYLDEARRLAKLVFTKYRDSRTGLLANHPPVATDSVLATTGPDPGVFYDSPMPAVQASAARCFMELATLTFDNDLAAKAETLLRPATAMLGGGIAGPSHGELAFALEEHERGTAIVAIAGDDSDTRTTWLVDGALAAYRPNKIIMRIRPNDPSTRLPEAMRAMVEASANRDTPLAFVCTGEACATPASTPDELAKILRTFGVETDASPVADASAPRTSP